MKKPVISKPADVDARMKILLHAPSGIGKTRFASTFPKPIFFDLEDGTSSVDKDVAVVGMAQFRSNNAFNPQLLMDYLDWLATPEAKEYETVVIDSITELQEQFMQVTIPKHNDPRRAYGDWAAYVRTLMTKLRALPKHFIVIARTKAGDNFEGTENMLLPQISPAAWTNVPSLADYGFYMTRKKVGLGNAAKMVPVLVTQATNAWTKTRKLLPAEINDPTFDTLRSAIGG